MNLQRVDPYPFAVDRDRTQVGTVRGKRPLRTKVARLFECDVLAEGVETKGQMDWLGHHSCKLVQGYFISHPLPMDAFTSWLAEKS